MSMGERHLADALDVPSDVDDFVGGAEKRAQAHAKKPSSSDTTVTSMRLKKATHKRLKAASIDLELSIQEIVDRAINEYLDRQINAPTAFNDEEDGL